MVVVSNKLVSHKEMIAWLLTTLKFKEIMETNLRKPQAKPITRTIPLGLYKSNPVLKFVLPPQPLPPPPPPPPLLDSPWIISIRENLEKARQYEVSSPWATLCIYRIPKSLRDVDETAYTPHLVSIGPYHRGRPHLLEMDRHKWRALHHALARADHDVRRYLDAARSLEDRARACYEAPLSISSDAFVECLVLDAIFTLELFRGVCLEGFSYLGYSPNDPVFANFGIMNSLQRDMIMLENQLPLFVLDSLFALQLGYELSGSDQVAHLALEFFDLFRPTDDLLPSNASSSGGLHCLDVFQSSFLCPKPASRFPSSNFGRWQFCSAAQIERPVADKRRRQLIHCVAKLRDKGIKFRCLKNVQFWDIKFKDGVLYIPRLLIYDDTKTLFLNLIAFEQCHFKRGQVITSYVTFMDNLIDSEVDVGYLRDMEIIEHWLGNDREVADMLNRLCKEVVFDLRDCYLCEVSEQVNRHCSHRRNTWGASFKHKYFSNPWAISSLIAAVVLLLLTAAQTFYAVYDHYKPN